MPLHLPTPPANVPETVRAKLHALADDSRFSTPALRLAQRDQLEVSTPHQVFTIGLDDITSGAGLAAAQPVGWRYLVTAGGEVLASAETAQAPDGTPQPPQFNEGRFAAATATAVHAARALPILEKAAFELRLLRIPGLYLMALWLHSPATDLLVPLAPSPIGKEGQIVPPAQLFGDLARQARARSTAAPERPGDGGPPVP
ncbi:MULTISPECIES: hypothetical protein [Streptosporangium]|uniref:Uncharacterized protein n=1 Tax=Streptosporangium brasiliense TaxID=47480 RepID=A0ABT9R953_9ACTN|nr:hypothetical protein [Streptosporangium brasiliense]MDP9865779.1 hypothetical protein [Streptosporangium brasiliense]